MVLTFEATLLLGDLFLLNESTRVVPLEGRAVAGLTQDCLSAGDAVCELLFPSITFLKHFEILYSLILADDVRIQVQAPK